MPNSAFRKFFSIKESFTLQIERLAGCFALKALLPAHCVLCGMPCGAGGGLCPPCHEELPRIQRPCRLCGLPGVQSEVMVCGGCLSEPPAWDDAVAALRYEYPVDRMVQAFKFRRDLACGQVLTEELLLAVEQCGRALPEVIFPVPLHFSRRFQRGFNQSELVARSLGKHLRIPVMVDELLRRKRTNAQSGLDRKARRRNIRRAFSCTEMSRGKVALVDDVLTTGTTLTECVRVMKRAGASEVTVWVAARVPLPG